MILFLLLLIFNSESTKSGLLYRLHHRVFVKLDTCLSKYGIISIDEEKEIFSFQRCTDEKCQECETTNSYKFKMNDFLPFPVFEGFGLTVQNTEISGVSARIVNIGPPEQKPNLVTGIIFSDESSCKSTDFSKAIIAAKGSTDDISKCYDFLPLGKDMSIRYDCDKTTKLLICKVFKKSRTCEGEGEACGFDECNKNMEIKSFCEDFDLSFFGKGVTFDISTDFYEKNGISKHPGCIKTTVTDDNVFIQRECFKDAEKKSCGSDDPNTECIGKTTIVQKFEMGESVPLNTSLSLIPLFSPYELYAYSNSPLELDLGEPTSSSLGHFDTEINHPVSNAKIYSFNQYVFEGCVRTEKDGVKYGSKRRCEKDGSITQLNFEGLDCTGKIVIGETITNAGKCGRFKHDFGDIFDDKNGFHLLTQLVDHEFLVNVATSLMFIIGICFVVGYCFCGCFVILWYLFGGTKILRKFFMKNKFFVSKDDLSINDEEWDYDNNIMEDDELEDTEKNIIDGSGEEGRENNYDIGNVVNDVLEEEEEHAANNSSDEKKVLTDQQQQEEE